MSSRLGNGYYKLKRDGKYAIIDSKPSPITPFQYDTVDDFDDNGLCKVRIDDRYGLVNKQGVEQVSVVYENISKKGRLYEVKQKGEVFIIDEFGNRQPESNE